VNGKTENMKLLDGDVVYYKHVVGLARDAVWLPMKNADIATSHALGRHQSPSVKVV
jgi:hypothetical protein